MRSTPKTMLLAIAVLAALALAATSASAIQHVQIVDEDTGQACSALTGIPPNGHTDGGCIAHANGTFSIRVDLVLFEVHEATCNLEIEMRVGPTGETGVYDVEHNTGPDANCSTFFAECDLPWEGNGEEDGATGVVHSNLSICFDPAESDSNCVGNLPFNVVEQNDPWVEHLETQFSAAVGLCEFDVDLELEHAEDVQPPAGVDDHEYIHINHP